MLPTLPQVKNHQTHSHLQGLFKQAQGYMFWHCKFDICLRISSCFKFQTSKWDQLNEINNEVFICLLVFECPIIWANEAYIERCEWDAVVYEAGLR